MLIFRKSIGAKLAATVLISVLGALFLMTAASTWHEVTRYSDAKQRELDTTAKIFASTISDHVADQDKTQTLKALRAIGRMPLIDFIEVFDVNNRTFVSLGSSVMLDGKNSAYKKPGMLDLLRGQPVRITAPVIIRTHWP